MDDEDGEVRDFQWLNFFPSVLKVFVSSWDLIPSSGTIMVSVLNIQTILLRRNLQCRNGGKFLSHKHDFF